jgi:malate dehydrogenase (oxaloacetate-decarboxylating)(NADP+)
MKIPVFHDDQHSTAIVVGAAILNGLKIVVKTPKIKLVTSGARSYGTGFPGRTGYYA